MNFQFSSDKDVYFLSGDVTFAGNHYKLMKKKLKQAEAQRKCKEWDRRANLASIHSQAEHDQMIELLKMYDAKRAWIGGNDVGQEREWRWVDGSTFRWTKWYPGEPNNSGGNEHCMELVGDAWVKNVWNDQSCDEQFMSICKIGAKNILT